MRQEKEAARNRIPEGREVIWDSSRRHWRILEGFRAGGCHGQSCFKMINLAVYWMGGFSWRQGQPVHLS